MPMLGVFPGWHTLSLLCLLHATTAEGEAAPKSVGSMPKSVEAVMKVAKARVEKAHEEQKQEWDCKRDLEHFSTKWTPEKQKFCCEHGMGCTGESGAHAAHSTSRPAAGHPGDGAKTLSLTVGQPFAHKVEPGLTKPGESYAAMARVGDAWPAWLQFDPVEGRIYGIPSTDAEEQNLIEVTKTTATTESLNHEKFKFQLTVLPAEADTTTAPTATAPSTTQAPSAPAPVSPAAAAVQTTMAPLGSLPPVAVTTTDAPASPAGHAAPKPLNSPAAAAVKTAAPAKPTSPAAHAAPKPLNSPAAAAIKTAAPAKPASPAALATTATPLAAAAPGIHVTPGATPDTRTASLDSLRPSKAVAPAPAMKKLAPSSKAIARAQQLAKEYFQQRLVRYMPKLPGPGHCWQQDAMCEPIDMNWSMDQVSIQAEDADDCQSKCRSRKDCGCFSYFPGLKSCHLASTLSTVQTGRVGFQGGRAACDEAMQGLRGTTVQQITRKRNCMLNKSFTPLQCSLDAPTAYVDDPVVCQRRCQEYDWCSSFVYNTLTKGCDLQCANATPIDSPVYSMSGPPTCKMDILASFTMECPSNFDAEAADWAEVLVEGFVHLAGRVHTRKTGQKTRVVHDHEIQVSMGKASDTSWNYQLQVEVDESRAMYLYAILKSASSSSRLKASAQNFTANAGAAFRSQCHPKLTMNSVEQDVKGDSFKKLGEQTLQRYSVGRTDMAEGVKFGWLLISAGGFAAILAVWTLPRWHSQIFKCRLCVPEPEPTCEPCLPSTVRQATILTADLDDFVCHEFKDSDGPQPSEEELAKFLSAPVISP